jgi:3-hydroxyisobutyrate dehydrogenase-like beta-hydroxyacid dehydrogenase
MSQAIRKVAFIGLGKMGSAMAGHLLDAGFELTVYNRTAAKTEPLVARGARPARSPRHAAAHVDAVVTNLMDDASVRAVVDGAEGLLAGLRPGSIHVGTTTNSPALAKELERSHGERGCLYVAAPVLGRPDAAAARKLVTLAAGLPEGIERSKPLLETWSAAVTEFGADPAVASSAKLCLNFFVVSLIDVIGEVFALADKSGVATETINAFFQMMLAHPGLKTYATRICQRDFRDVGFELAGGLKDANLILDAARAAAVPLGHAEVVCEKFREAAASGMGLQDWAAVTEITRRRAERAANER